MDEYCEHIEKEPVLARRFQHMFISEPTKTDTILILKGLKERKKEGAHDIRLYYLLQSKLLCCKPRPRLHFIP